MNVALSKLAGGLLAPMSLALIVLAVGALCLWLPWPWFRAFGRVLLGGLLVAALLLSLLPLERLYLGTLERRFPVPTLPAEVKGIVVLGGGLAWGDPAGPRLGSFSADRALAAAALARQHPEALVVLSGGGYGTTAPDPAEARLTEAGLMAELLLSLGIPRERLLIEDRSRTTWENATLSHAAVQPRAGDTWVLVTSAAHLPRAVGAFRAAGWENILPYPVAALAARRDWFDLRFRPLQAMNALSIAEHEWLGLLAYRLAGQSSALFPAP